MELEPSTSAFLESADACGLTPVRDATPDEVREMVRLADTLRGDQVALTDVHDHEIDAPGGRLRVRVLRPTERPLGVMLYLQGAGWIAESLADAEPVARKLAERTGLTCVLVEHRLAPDNPFPAAIEDVAAAMDWVLGERPECLEPTEPLILVGEGAGANLVSVLARRLRDDGRADAVALQVLVSPVIDPHSVTGDRADDLRIDRAALERSWKWYLPNGNDRQHPDATLMATADLSGLPPTVLILPEADPTFDEGQALAQRLRASGVPVVVRPQPGQIYGALRFLHLRMGEMAFQQIVRSVQTIRSCRRRFPSDRRAIENELEKAI